MIKVMILTRNILAETTLQNRLQNLNFEVYCSSSLLERSIMDRDITYSVKQFDHVIISDQISDREMLQIISQLSKLEISILRKVDGIPSQDEEDYLKRLGLNGWLQATMTNEELREMLSGTFSKEIISGKGVYDIQMIEKKIPIRDLPLSSMEKDFIAALYKKEGAVLSREEASEALWSRCDRSTMSRLSMMKKSIENKLRGTNLPSPLFVTIWGKGYQAKEELFKCVIP